MDVTALRQGSERKGFVDRLGFLKADDVGPLLIHQVKQEVQPQPDRIDVPGGDAHGSYSKWTEVGSSWRAILAAILADCPAPYLILLKNGKRPARGDRALKLRFRIPDTAGVTGGRAIASRG